MDFAQAARLQVRASSSRGVVAQRLTDPDNAVRIEALDALGKLEPAALAEHSAAIVQRLADASKGARGAMQRSLDASPLPFAHSDYTQTQGPRSDYRAEAHPVRTLGCKVEPDGALVEDAYTRASARGQMRRSDSAGAERGPSPSFQNLAKKVTNSQKLFRTFSEPSQNLPLSHNLAEEEQGVNSHRP